MEEGALLVRIASAKERGWDFTLHSSWCSEQRVFILRLRAPGVDAHAARTRVGALIDVLRWGAREVGK